MVWNSIYMVFRCFQKGYRRKHIVFGAKRTDLYVRCISSSFGRGWSDSQPIKKNKFPLSK